MLLRRSALALRRQVAIKSTASRTFTTSIARRAESQGDPKPGQPDRKMIPFEDIKTAEDLLPPGAEPGTVPTDLDQSTGLERLEILGKMQGIDVFDMRPLDASRKGTLDNPIMVKSYGDEHFAGCTGYPADSHLVHWLNLRRDRAIERCPECGGVYSMEYVGPPDDPHAHGHGDEYVEAKTFADFVRPEYRGTPEGYVNAVERGATRGH